MRKDPLDVDAWKKISKFPKSIQNIFSYDFSGGMHDETRVNFIRDRQTIEQVK